MAAPPSRHPSSLILGTVQFGLAYGVSNTEGQVAADAAQAIVDRAASAGLKMLDTAAAYGQAEAVVQHVIAPHSAVSVVTKAPRVENGDVEAALVQARASLERFGPSRTAALLVHSAWDLMEPYGDRLWNGLVALKSEGLTPRIGFSAYPGDSVLKLAARFGPDVVQVPASVFDQRLVRSGEIEALADHGVEVHVRSLFLQGLAFMTPETVPDRLTAARPKLERWWRALVANAVTPARAALDFGLSIRGAAKLVIGVTSVRELDEQLAQFAEPGAPLNFADFAIEDEAVLDPWRW